MPITITQPGGGGGGGGSGAPTAAKYVTTAAHADLSAEVGIPGLIADADVAAAAGAGTSEEWDSATTGLTWSPSDPNTVNSNTTVASHLYVLQTDTTLRFGTKSWSPAGAFDARCKVSVLMLDQGATTNARGGIIVGNSDLTTYARADLVADAGSLRWQMNAFTFASSTLTQRGSSWTCGDGTMYLRVKRDGSNNCSFYFSYDGINWQFIATQSLTFTAAKLGVFVQASATMNAVMLFDWLRTDV